MRVNSEKGSTIEGTKWTDNGFSRGGGKYDKTKIFMVLVHNRKQSTLLPIIQKWIKPGSIIHSDCWKAYSKLSKLGYTHVK